jgi:hypothetical protein
MNQEPNTRKTDRELHVRIWGVPPNDPAGSDLAYEGRDLSARAASRTRRGRAPRGGKKNLGPTTPSEPATESSTIAAEEEDIRLIKLRESIVNTVEPQIDEIRSAVRDLKESQAIIIRRLSLPSRPIERRPVKPLSERIRRRMGGRFRRKGGKFRRNLLVLLAVPLLLGIGATLATAYLNLGSIPASSDPSGGLKELLVLNGTSVTWVNLVFGLGSMFVAAGLGLTLTRTRAGKKTTRLAESRRRA